MTSERSKIGDSYNHQSSHAHRYLQLRGHVPETDLPIVATSNDGAKVVHHQHSADTVSGSCAAPENYGENQAVPWHDAARSGMSGERQKQRDTLRQKARDIKGKTMTHCFKLVKIKVQQVSYSPYEWDCNTLDYLAVFCKKYCSLQFWVKSLNFLNN